MEKKAGHTQRQNKKKQIYELIITKKKTRNIKCNTKSRRTADQTEDQRDRQRKRATRRRKKPILKTKMLRKKM